MQFVFLSFHLVKKTFFRRLNFKNFPGHFGKYLPMIFKQDKLEYEGKIESIESSDEGQCAVVKLVGYPYYENVWLKDLLESKGEAARLKQTKELFDESCKRKLNFDEEIPSKLQVHIHKDLSLVLYM